MKPQIAFPQYYWIVSFSEEATPTPLSILSKIVLKIDKLQNEENALERALEFWLWDNKDIIYAGWIPSRARGPIDFMVLASRDVQYGEAWEYFSNAVHDNIKIGAFTWKRVKYLT
jgi:hypothetical protein